MSYKVELQNFEGPMDLLLYFIKRDELDIYDIPISHITREFMAVLIASKILSVRVLRRGRQGPMNRIEVIE